MKPINSEFKLTEKNLIKAKLHFLLSNKPLGTQLRLLGINVLKNVFSTLSDYNVT